MAMDWTQGLGLRPRTNPFMQMATGAGGALANIFQNGLPPMPFQMPPSNQAPGVDARGHPQVYGQPAQAAMPPPPRPQASPAPGAYGMPGPPAGAMGMPGGAGPAAAPNPGLGAAPSGMPGAGGGAAPMPTKGLINYSDLLNDPKQAVFQALMDLGMDPYSTGIRATALRQRAGDVIGQILPQLLGSNDVEADLPGLIRAQVQRAMSGAPVFYGGHGGMDALNALRGAESATMAGPNGERGGTEGQRFLADMLGQGDQATGIIGNLLYGGANPALGRTLEQQLAPLAWLATRNAAQPGAPDRTFLQQYLGR